MCRGRFETPKAAARLPLCKARTAVRVALPRRHNPIKMCRDPRHTLTLPPKAAKHNPPERRT